jgi:hypothetical protein
MTYRARRKLTEELTEEGIMARVRGLIDLDLMYVQAPRGRGPAQVVFHCGCRVKV